MFSSLFLKGKLKQNWLKHLGKSHSSSHAWSPVHRHKTWVILGASQRVQWRVQHLMMSLNLLSVFLRLLSAFPFVE